MRTLALVLAALIALPAVAEAQASVGFHIDLPVVLPRLVVVSPGIQVVPECEEEVFFTNGYYWVRRDNGWWRSRSHRGGWAMAPVRAVPGRLGQFPPGQYRHWKAEKRAEKAYKAEVKAARHDRDEGRDRDEGHGRGRGHGKH